MADIIFESSRQESEPKREPKHPPGGVLEIIFLAIPIVISMMAQVVMGIVDTYFMGDVSTVAQGAVGFGGVLVWGFFCFFGGLLNGVNTFASQLEGEERYAEVGAFVWQGLWLALGSSLCVILLAPLLTPLLSWFQTPPEVAPITSAYASIRIVYGGPLFFLSATIQSFLRGIGDTKTPMKITLLVMILNIPLSYLLIFGGFGVDAMGVEGAAWGTVLAQVIGTLLYVAFFWVSKTVAKYETHAFSFSPKRLLRLLKVSVPIGIQWFLEMGSWTLFTAYVARWGDVALASHQIAVQMMHLSFMPSVAISIAATTLVGQYIGAKKSDISKKSGNAAIRLSVAYMALMGVVFFCCGQALTSLFNSQPEVIRLGTKILMIAALFQAMDGLAIATSGALRGAGDTQFPMVLSLVLGWGVFVPCVYLFGEVIQGGLYGAWFAAVVYSVLLGALLFWRWCRGRWQAIQV